MTINAAAQATAPAQQSVLLITETPPSRPSQVRTVYVQRTEVGQFDNASPKKLGPKLRWR